MLSWCVLGLGCEDKPTGPAPARFAAVKKRTDAAGTAFCDQQFPAKGEGSKRFVPAALRPFGDVVKPAKGWTWVNVWATWCTPCVEEMSVLARWSEAISREGLALNFELLSIDEAVAQPELEKWRGRKLPGPISWVRSEADFIAFLEGLGVEKTASIPIHVLVDPENMVRCVRVGAIHEQNYGAVRDFVSGG